MLALQHDGTGVDGLSLTEVPTPEPADDEALIRVRAAAITRDELSWHTLEPPIVPCHEVSGVVVSASGTSMFGPDDEVFSLIGFDRDGAAAEYVTVPTDRLAPKPEALSHIQSAAVPLGGLSAWQGLFDLGRLASGETVLVHGAGGGVGAYAVQLALSCGAQVVATASAPRLEYVRRLGAHKVIDHSAARFEEALGHVDLVFDTTGGDRLERSVEVLGPGGRLISVATRPPVDRANERRVEASFFIVEPNAVQLQRLGELAKQGRLEPAVDRVYDLGSAVEAFQRSLGGEAVGKVVFDVSSVDDA